MRQRKQALKIKTPSSEASHKPTRREENRSRHHYLPLFQRRDECVYYTLSSVRVSDRLYLLSYCNSTNRNSRTLVLVILSPPFCTKEEKRMRRKKAPPCFFAPFPQSFLVYFHLIQVSLFNPLEHLEHLNIGVVLFILSPACQDRGRITWDLPCGLCQPDPAGLHFVGAVLTKNRCHHW